MTPVRVADGILLTDKVFILQTAVDFFFSCGVLSCFHHKGDLATGEVGGKARATC